MEKFPLRDSWQLHAYRLTELLNRRRNSCLYDPRSNRLQDIALFYRLPADHRTSVTPILSWTYKWYKKRARRVKLPHCLIRNLPETRSLPHLKIFPKSSAHAALLLDVIPQRQGTLSQIHLAPSPRNTHFGDARFTPRRHIPPTSISSPLRQLPAARASAVPRTHQSIPPSSPGSACAPTVPAERRSRDRQCWSDRTNGTPCRWSLEPSGP